MLRSPPGFKDALDVLLARDVDLIVVGGVAGVPISTFDLDIMHARDAANVERLLAALADLDATHRDPAGGSWRPTGEKPSPVPATTC